MSKQLMLFVFLFCGFAIFSSCKKEIIVPIFIKVVETQNQEPIEGARVIYNASQPLFTDENGECSTNFELEHFLADSISLFVSKDGFHANNFSSIVGNTQKDIYVIELERK